MTRDTTAAPTTDAGPALPPRHAPFCPGFLGTALATAILGGFGLAGHLRFVIGFGLPLGPAFPALVQAHGHAQLVGWAGLLVMGFSLHFIPRLVAPMFWLVNAATALRLIPLILPSAAKDLTPAVGGSAPSGFGLSG
jgi:uncharacterized protein involved in response to NO